MPYRRAHPINRGPADVDEDFAPAGYTLHFEEDWTAFQYDQDGVSSKWLPYWPDTGRFQNDQEQIYVNSEYEGTTAAPLGLNPFTISGSPPTLTITIDALTAGEQADVDVNPETSDPPVYWSGALSSPRFHKRTRGYWVIRCRSSVVAGMWPAFWLFNDHREFPDEYDVFEFIGEWPTVDHANLHFGNPSYAELVSKKAYVQIVPGDWNVYAVRVTDVGAELSINGIIVNRPIFTGIKPLHMRLNMAVWPPGIDPGDLPATLEIAWIRYYEAASEPLLNEPWTGGNGDPWNFINWTPIEFYGATTVVDIQNNQGRLSPGGEAFAAVRALSNTIVFADFEATAKFTLGTTGEQYHDLNFRASRDWKPTNYIQPADGYAFHIEDGFLQVMKNVAEVRSAVASVSKTWGTGQWNARLLVQGPFIKARVWQGSEPGTWDIDTADGSHAEGIISIGSANGNAATARPIAWDDLLVETATAVATVFEEAWTGTDTAAWHSGRWPETSVTWTSIVDIQGDQGRLLPQGAAFAGARALSAGPDETWSDGTSWSDGSGWAGSSAALTDFTATAQFTISSLSEQYHQFLFRASGGAGASPSDAYEIEVIPEFALLRLYSRVGGTPSIVTTVGKTWNTSPWRLRIMAVGTRIRARAWQGTEPEAWDIDLTNPDHSAGVVGFASFNGADPAAARPILWDNLAVVETP